MIAAFTGPVFVSFRRRSRRDVYGRPWDGSPGLPRALGGGAAAASLGGECDFRRLGWWRCREGYGRVWSLLAGPGSPAIRAVPHAARGQALGGSWCFAAPIRLRPDFEGCWRARGLLFARPRTDRPGGQPSRAWLFGQQRDDTDRPSACLLCPIYHTCQRTNRCAIIPARAAPRERYQPSAAPAAARRPRAGRPR